MLKGESAEGTTLCSRFLVKL